MGNLTLASKISVTHTALTDGVTLITLHGMASGPTLALLGGVHGDEDEGVLAVHRVLAVLADAPLVGTVRAVAPTNRAAWLAQSRIHPADGKDLARNFPGDAGGTPTAVLAAAVTEQVIAGADLVVDLHSAGLRYQMPLFCGFVSDNSAAARSRRAAIAFGAPIIWSHRDAAPGRTLSVAADRGIPAMYAECGGGGGILSRDLDTYVEGVLAVMADIDMLPAAYRRVASHRCQWVHGGGDLDRGASSGHDGLFVSTAAAGAVLGANEEIGRIYDFEGHLLEVLRSPSQTMLMFLRRQARIRTGDTLFALADLGQAEAAPTHE